MKQLRYLKTIELDKGTTSTQSNGARVTAFTKVADYRVQTQELTDEISVSIYGSDIDRMYRISSPRYTLEAYLAGKNNNSDDNVSQYTILLNNARYRIRAVKEHWIDIELMGDISHVSI